MRIVLLLLGILGLAPSAMATEGLEGTWFGERWAGGTRLVQHLSHRTPDGRYTVRFRFFRGCEETGAQAQAGRWELDGAEFRTWIETMNGAPARPDGVAVAITYVVEDRSGDRIAYRAPNGVLHRAFRVPADYRMPPPLGCEARS